MLQEFWGWAELDQEICEKILCLQSLLIDDLILYEYNPTLFISLLSLCILTLYYVFSLIQTSLPLVLVCLHLREVSFHGVENEQLMDFFSAWRG